jgi:hypothetical protein
MKCINNLVTQNSFIVTSLVLVLFFIGTSAFAAIPEVYTNDNIWESEHDIPVSIDIDEYGNFFGITATGKTFTQMNIENN